MAKVCTAGNTCPYSQQQTTGGCPAAEVCPGYTAPDYIEYAIGTPPAPVFEINGIDYSNRLRWPFDVNLNGQRIVSRAIYKDED